MGKFITRREFIKGTCTSTLLGGVLPQIPLPPPNLLPSDDNAILKSRNNPSPLSLVVDVKSKKDIIRGSIPDISLVKQMMGKGITSLTGKNDPKDAWKSLFHEDEKIGIKINGFGSDMLIGNYQICRAIVDVLKETEVKENNIIIWDQFQKNLRPSGFRINMSLKGVRVFGTDRGEGKKALDSSSSHREYDSGYGAVRISKILTEEVDSLINLCLLKDHNIAGVTLSLKNISHGVISHPNKFHKNSCDPFIAGINSIPIIGDKIKLHICNSILGLFDGGPRPKKRHLWRNNGILLSKDPVALDTICMNIIEEKRIERNLPSLFNRPNLPKHIETAAKFGLGKSSINLIKHKIILV